jgi:hypothetical protein
MFMDEERSGDVIELFGDLFAERFTRDFARRALPLGFRQFIAMLFTSKGGRKRTTPGGSSLRGGRNFWHRLCRGWSGLLQECLQFREQGISLGIELLAPWAIETSQELFQLLLQPGIGALFLMQRVEQFPNHQMTQRNVIRQQERNRRNVNVRAHAQ